jgi:hypothetical protein
MMAMIEGEGEFLKQGKEVGSLFSAFVVPRVTFGVLTKANFSWLRGYSGFRPPRLCHNVISTEGRNLLIPISCKTGFLGIRLEMIL